MNDLAPEQIHQILADHRHTSKNQLVTDIKSYVSQQNAALLRELIQKKARVQMIGADGMTIEADIVLTFILEAKLKTFEEAYGR